MRTYFLTTKELAAYTRKSDWTIRKKCREGKYHPVKEGRDWLIPIVEIRKAHPELSIEFWEEVSEDLYKSLGGLQSVEMRLERRKQGRDVHNGRKLR